MATNAALIASIISDTSAHLVNRDEKMSRTLDKMCSNHASKIEKGVTGRIINRDAAELRGYGNGRNQGD